MLWFLSLIDCYYCHDIQSQTGATMGKWGRKRINGANVSENSSWNFEIPTGCGATSKICFKKKITPKTWGRDVCPFWLICIFFKRGLKETQPPNELTPPSFVHVVHRRSLWGSWNDWWERSTSEARGNSEFGFKMILWEEKFSQFEYQTC